MATTELDTETAMAALETLEQMIERQRAKVLAIARRLRPELAEGELRNAHAYPEIQQDPAFEFEAGQLAGLRAAKIAVQARLFDGTMAQG